MFLQMKSSFLKTILRGAVIFALCSCTKTLHITDYARSGEVLGSSERARVLETLTNQGVRYHSMRMLSRCELTHDGEHYLFRYAFVATKTGDLRIEQLPTTGFYSLAALASDGRETIVIVPAEKKAFRAAPGGTALSEFFGMDLPIDEKSAGYLLAGLLGANFLDSAAEVRGIPGDPSFIEIFTDHYFAQFREYRLERFHYFHPQDKHELFSLTLRRDGEELPRAFELVLPRYGASLSCQSVQRAYNPLIRTEVFHLEIPHGYDIRSAF